MILVRTGILLLALVVLTLPCRPVLAQTLDGNLGDLINPNNPDDGNLTLRDGNPAVPLDLQVQNAICLRGITSKFNGQVGAGQRVLTAAEIAVVRAAIVKWESLFPGGLGPVTLCFVFDQSLDTQLGETQAEISGKSQKPVSCNIRFNSNVRFFVDPTPGQDGDMIPTGEFDLLTVALHEIGHALGFFGNLRVAPLIGRPSGGTAPLVCDGVQTRIVADPSTFQLHLDPQTVPNSLMIPNLPAGQRRTVDRNSIESLLLACIYGYDVVPEGAACNGARISGLNIGRVRNKLSRQLDGSLFIGLDLAFDAQDPFSNRGNPFDVDGDGVHQRLGVGVGESVFGLSDTGCETYLVCIDFGNDNENTVGLLGDPARPYDLSFTIESCNGVLPSAPNVTRIIDNVFNFEPSDIQFSFGPPTGPGGSPTRDIEFRVSSLRNRVVFLGEGPRNYNNVYNIFTRVVAMAEQSCSADEEVFGSLRLGQDPDIPPLLVEITKLVLPGMETTGDGTIDDNDAFMIDDFSFRPEITALPGAVVFYRINLDNASPVGPSSGNAELVSVTDSLLGGDITSDFGGGVGQRLPYGARPVSASYATSLLTDTLNIATVVADFDPNDPNLPATRVTTTDDAYVDVVTPDLECEISARRTIPGFPGRAVITLKVTNTGETDLELVTLDSTVLALLGFVPPAPFDLPVGDCREFLVSVPLPDEASCAAIGALDGVPDTVLDFEAMAAGQVKVVNDEPAVLGPDGNPVADFLQDHTCPGSFDLCALSICDDPVPSDVSGTKTVTGDFIEGGAVQYVIHLTNAALNDQPDLAGPELVDDLPEGIEIVSVMATSGMVQVDPVARRVEFNGVIPAMGSVMIVIDARVAFSTMGSTLCNQARIFYDGFGCGGNDVERLTDDPTVLGDEDPTCFTIPVAEPTEIPGLGELGLLFLALLFGGAVVLRRP